MISRRRLAIITIIIFNLVPVVGVAFYNWSPFEMFWLFWMETLIISFFDAIRVMCSQQQLEINEPPSFSFRFNIAAAFKYLLVKIFIFFFYALFIVVFIGFVAHKEKEPIRVVQTLAFQNKLFNLALLLAFCTQAFYLVKYFFQNRSYVYASPFDFPLIFDGRQIVIHVAVVLGAVGSSFLFKGDGYTRYGSVWVIAILCVTKTIFELYFSRADQDRQPSHSVA